MLNALAGCVTPIPLDESSLSAESIEQHRLPPLRDGATRREQITIALGEPTHQLDHGRIAGYRMMLHHDEQATLELCKEHGYNPLFAEGINLRRQWVAEHGELQTLRMWKPAAYPYDDPAKPRAEYELVLIFDSSGVLQRHRFAKAPP